MTHWLFTMVVATAMLVAPISASRAERPNVILIMTDDQGGWDLSCMGNPVLKTPNIDRLAEGGMKMERFYVSPVCTPTRSCLMTGRYNYRTRAIDTYVGRAMMDPAEVTIAEVLRDAGYATGIFGKWHLGDNYPMRAMDQGFTESLVIRGGGIGQPSDPVGGEGRYTDPILFHNGRQVQKKGYCTDVYFNAAMDWIEKNHAAGRSFFSYIATNAPHEPLMDVPADQYERCKKLDLRKVLVVPPGPGQMDKELDRLARIFAMVANIDDNVGRLLDRLKALGILDHTLVIFLTDNGPNTMRFVGPLRGMKSNVYEGGIRTAFLAQWPARIGAGTSCESVAAHIDVMPTILEACGVAVPEGLKLDGRSFLPLLEGKKHDWPSRTLFLQSHRGDVPVMYHHFAAIAWPWKLANPSGFGRVRPESAPRFELYNLADDPAERNNVIADHPDIADRLRGEYETWFKEVGSTRPDNYAPPRIQIGTPNEDPVVLTRQNWRRSTGEQTGYGQTGTWLLDVARDGRYDIRLRFPADDAGRKAVLKIQDIDLSLEVPAGASECLFRQVALKQGHADLTATLAHGRTTVGPWQVDIVQP